MRRFTKIWFVSKDADVQLSSVSLVKIYLEIIIIVVTVINTKIHD